MEQIQLFQGQNTVLHNDQSYNYVMKNTSDHIEDQQEMIMMHHQQLLMNNRKRSIREMEENFLGNIVQPVAAAPDFSRRGFSGEDMVVGKTGTVSYTNNRNAPVDELAGIFSRQAVELDGLIRQQGEKLRKLTQDCHRESIKSILSLVGFKLHQRLAEKDAELTVARRYNYELQQRARLVESDCLAWQDRAAKSESMLSAMNLHVQNQKALITRVVPDSGDSTDAQSCCNGSNDQMEAPTQLCRICQQRPACVLIQPCRHICLCAECVDQVSSCVLCGSVKNACIHVLF